MNSLLQNLNLSWFEDSYWAWRNAWYYRFGSYEDSIDRRGAFFDEINLGWIEMQGELLDPWNLRGRDTYYSYVMSQK